MPDNWQVQNGVSTSSIATTDKLEEAMWQLKIQTQEDQDGVASHSAPYPDRPGEPDCIYYLRTGLCGYGNNCRFNHPAYAGQAAQHRGELPERAGQPDCQYFMKTGTCKFGATCKYNHPRDRYDAGQVPLNILGLPMRQEEKSCPFYMRTGSCKFGIACKFHHPQPATLGAVLPVTGPTAYGSAGSTVAPPSGFPYAGGLPAWSLPRAPSISGPPMQGSQAYMPVVLSSSQGLLPAQPGWSTYMGTMTSVSSTNVLGSNLVYTSKHQGESGSSGPVHSPSFPQFPERPEQPECQYYMKTGRCKFGPTCKYHHPREKITPLATNSMGPYGLPLRPGQTVCTFYKLYGICKYGSACKFDHPLAGFYNYGVSMPSLPLPDPPLIPYQRNSLPARSSETSPSKSSRLPDQMKPDVPNAKQQNLDTKAPEDPEQEPLSSTNPEPTSLETPLDQSD
ncbi:zinc finger protein [Macleaya cordata]|uniref:Zinc finger protein n=1 Tax=Macleaya cordata TaxID=56857 RepID=A0A200RBD5_MACCD|nr:zinc finger protein [Macleaya cordata]